jgi:hypothetical protein
MSDEEHDFQEKPHTTTRLQPLQDEGYVIVVTRAFGPNGEQLIDEEGPRFSGEPGVKIHVEQGDKEDDVWLSPFYGDPSKEYEVDFDEGERCKLTCPESGAQLDKIPGIQSEDGGHYYAVYLSPQLEEGELVAINDVWGNTDSRLLSEGELLDLYAEQDEAS